MSYAWSYRPVPIVRRWLPTCGICNQPVTLETSKTDEYGQAIHGECYVLKIRLKQAATSLTGRKVIQCPRSLGHYAI